MDTRYEHLSDQERAVILSERSRGSSARVIGRLLGRSASTVTRDLARDRVRPDAGRSAVPSSTATVWPSRQAG